MKSILFVAIIISIFTVPAFGQNGFLVDYLTGDLVKIDLTAPTNEILIGNVMSFMTDIEFGPDNVLYGLPLQGTEFIQIDTTSAAYTQVGTSTPLASHMWSGLAFDVTTGTMFASSTTGNSESAFYTIDVTTGTATLIGTSLTAYSVADISFDADGQLYAHNLQDEIYLIDKTNGSATYLGETGYQAAGPWHGMDYCYDNDTMYLSTYNAITFQKTLKTVDLTTGLATDVGTLNHSTGGFALTNPVPELDPPNNFAGEVQNFNDVQLTWETPGTTRELLGYTIYKDGTELVVINDPAILEYLDAALDVGTYEYEIVANYDEGNSDTAGPLEVIVTLPAPTDLTATSAGLDISIEWTAPTALRDLQSYTLYKDGSVLTDGLTTTTYLDDNVGNGEFTYEVSAVYDGGYESDLSDPYTIQHTSSGGILIPQITELQGNYPNPFNPTTNIKFAISEPGYLILEVYNIRGEKVCTLLDDKMEAQYHTIVWDGKDSNRKPVSSGVYFYKMKAGKYVETKKMMLIK